MELEFKTDFEQVRQRWDSFWKNEALSRPLVSIVSPKDGVEPRPKPSSVASVENDLNVVIEQLLAWADSHVFLGDAIPFYQIQFGPDHFSALLGAELKFHPDNPDTSWCVPFVENWDDAEIKFHPESQWWEKTIRSLRAFRARCDGKVLITGPNLQAGLDCLSAIRGPQNLLMDVITDPDKVKRALDSVCLAYEQALNALSIEQDTRQFGSITRHQMYCHGLVSVPQCDFSCMISPEMFREFEVSCLKREIKSLDASTYHLDGPDAIVHLPAICEIEGIDVIQWQPGAGEAAEKDWTCLHKKIDLLGKGQVFGGGGIPIRDYEIVRKMRQQLDCRKLFFVAEASSQKQAQNFLEQLEQFG
ncbi:MAG: hypothetical protein PHF37_01400 [Phycisphaerae bacterium]|nr:hypothetical protein [Phycisphaerae bacterium]